MSIINFQVENWFDCKEEIKQLLNLHWEEVANNEDCIFVKMDEEGYDELAKKNILHVITLRNNNKVIGYYGCFVKHHLHYKDSLTASTDVYYILPEFRKGYTGIKLFTFLENYLKSIGVQRVISSTKIKHDKSVIFKRLKWQETEKVYTKILN